MEKIFSLTLPKSVYGTWGMTSHTFVIADHQENILGYDILKGKLWKLPTRDVWSCGPNKNPTVIFLGRVGKSISYKQLQFFLLLL